MSYRVKIDNYEGPFDLLLRLVNQQKVAIGELSLSHIADQYLEEIGRRKSLDLEVASDFMLVASTLLEMKAASLLPQDEDVVLEQAQEYSPSELRAILVERLINYKKFKNAAQALSVRLKTQERMHPRLCGPDPSFYRATPDYLEGVQLAELGKFCATILGRQDIFVLESERIEREIIPVESQIQHIYDRLVIAKKARFSDFVDKSHETQQVVVTFLAILELFKRSVVRLAQEDYFGDITITYVEGSTLGTLDEENDADLQKDI